MAKQLSRIELLKQKLAEEKAKKEKAKKENGGGNYTNDIYPFWQMAVGDSARVRILPDKNEDNDYIFFVDRLEHKISINGEDKKIPCRTMFGEDCPICDLSRKYYKEEGKESKNGKYYYRNKTSIVRVLVVEDPLPPNKDSGETFEGKVLNTQFGFQLMEKIKEQISSDDLGDFTDLDDGTDFIIKKTPQGNYGTYSVGSQFARKSGPVDSELRDSIETVDLSSLLPKDLGYEKVYNMLQAHLSGEEYEEDDDSKKEEAKPSKKTEEVAGTPSKPSRAVKEEKEEVEESDDDAPPARTKTSPKKEVEEVVVEEDDDGEDDIIAKLRARKNAAKK